MNKKELSANNRFSLMTLGIVSLCINKQAEIFARDKSQNRTTTIADREWEPTRIKSSHETWTRNLGYWNWINNYSPLVVFCRLSGGKFSFLISWGLFVLPPEMISKYFSYKLLFASESLSHSPLGTLFSFFLHDHRLKIMRHEKHVMFVKFMRYGYTWEIFHPA